MSVSTTTVISCMRCWPNRCLVSLACAVTLLGLSFVGPALARADSSPGGNKRSV